MRSVDPREACLHGTNPRDRGVVMSWGVGYPNCEDILSSPPKDWYVERTNSKDPSCTLLIPDGKEPTCHLARAMPLLLGCKQTV